MKSRPFRSRAATRGFTLAEIAVTIVIVGIGLTLVLQGLNTSKKTAAQTRNMKLARELGLYTLGQVECGLYSDDIEEGLRGDYSQEGWPDFSYEVAVGDQTFTEEAPEDPDDPNKPWDNGARARADQQDSSSSSASASTKDSEEEEEVEPYEKVRVRVRFPKISDAKNELVLERWVPWEQVYGEAEDQAPQALGGTQDAGGAGSTGSGGGSGAAGGTAGAK